MKLYHGFRNFENILIKDKLESHSLQHFDPHPLMYVYCSLLYAAGTKHILPKHQFEVKKLLNKHIFEISETAKNNFNVDLPIEDVIKYTNILNDKFVENTREFYRTKGIYFSKKPLFSPYANFFGVEVPENLIQPSPQGFPIVAGELSLNYVTNLLVKDEYRSLIEQILEKHNKNFRIETY